MSVLTLLTDFGTPDGYAAELKGVILGRAPLATLVDITHEIPPGDIAAGAYTLGRCWRSFPAGTVHLAVVDPGVGTARRALACEAGGHSFVAPDNGLLTAVLGLERPGCVELAVPAGASPVFHGRDVFAPAAAALALGIPLVSLGKPVTDAVRLPAPRLVNEQGRITGEVIHVDRFGTLVTNIPAAQVAAGDRVRAGGREIAVRRTFADVAAGEPLAYGGSGGTIEIAVRDGRADILLALHRGNPVEAGGQGPV